MSRRGDSHLRSASDRARISVIIPTYNESSTIATCLARLACQDADEVIVADGSSPDGTALLAEQHGARVVRTRRGRGLQQNRAAAAASGDVLLFLHADCWLEPGALEVLRRFLGRHPRIPGGCFRMQVADPDPRFRAINAAADLRAGLLGIPYGDQALFAPRWAFNRIGGFPELPLMDDVHLSLRLRHLGRLAVLPARVYVSPRRWQRQGLMGQTFRNWALTALAVAGVPTHVLARFYPVVR